MMMRLATEVNELQNENISPRLDNSDVDIFKDGDIKMIKDKLEDKKVESTGKRSDLDESFD